MNRTPRCPHRVNADPHGELYVCTLPMGHDGMHVVIEQYRVESEGTLI